MTHDQSAGQAPSTAAARPAARAVARLHLSGYGTSLNGTFSTHIMPKLVEFQLGVINDLANQSAVPEYEI